MALTSWRRGRGRPATSEAWVEELLTAGVELDAAALTLTDRPAITRAPDSRIRLGSGVFLGGGNTVATYRAGAVIEVGADTVLSAGTSLLAVQSVVVGADCLIGWGSDIIDSDFHTLGGATPTQPVRVRDHVWIGARAMVLKGVTVGEGAVVAAGSIVTRDVPPRTLVRGNPAAVVRHDVTWDRELA